MGWSADGDINAKMSYAARFYNCHLKHLAGAKNVWSICLRNGACCCTQMLKISVRLEKTCYSSAIMQIALRLAMFQHTTVAVPKEMHLMLSMCTSDSRISRRRATTSKVSNGDNAELLGRIG